MNKKSWLIIGFVASFLGFLSIVSALDPLPMELREKIIMNNINDWKFIDSDIILNNVFMLQ